MRTLLFAPVLALGLVAATAATAAAKDDFDQFVADLAAKPDAAKTYLKNCQTLVTPHGDVRSPCALTLADLVGTQTGATLVVKQNKSAFFPKSQLQYREALVELRVAKKTVATFRVIEIGSVAGNPDEPWVLAAHWAKLMTDKDATAAANAGTLVAPPPIKAGIVPDTSGSDQDKSDREQATDKIEGDMAYLTDWKGWMAATLEGKAIAFGSGPKQRYTGKAGKKTVEKWKLSLTPDGKVAIDGGAWVLWGTTHVVAQPTTPGAKPITYVLFAAYGSGLTPGGGSFITFPAIFSFAIAQ